MDLFTLILCGVCLSSHEPSLSTPEPLYSHRAAHPQRGFRHTISHGYSTISDAAVGDLQTPKSTSRYLQQHCPSHTVSLRSQRTEQSFGYKLPNNYSFQPSDVMWLSLIIHLLHRVTLVTEMHLWSQRSNHDRRLNKLHTISFIPYMFCPRRAVVVCISNTLHVFWAILHMLQRHKRE